MKKKIFAAILCAAMAASLAACGGGSPASSAAPATDSKPAESTAPAETAPADADYGTGEIKIWVADNVTDFTKGKVDEFMKANPQFAGYTVTVEAVGEGDAAGNNDAGAVGAATVGDTLYAYPLTSDNGYFLYYDKSVVKDPSTLEGIIADCEAAGKNFYMEINSGWYNTAFFFGTGCQLSYDTDDTGKFTACNIDYVSDKGLVALKEMVELKASPAFQNGSSVGNATNAAAIVDGTWDSGAAQDLFGDNYACAKLPTFTGSSFSA